MKRRLVCRNVGDLHITYVGMLGSNPQLEVSNPVVGHIHSTFSRYSLTGSYFLIAKEQGFSTKLGFFDKRALFFSKFIRFPTQMKQFVIPQNISKIGKISDNFKKLKKVNCFS